MCLGFFADGWNKRNDFASKKRNASVAPFNCVQVTDLHGYTGYGPSHVRVGACASASLPMVARWCAAASCPATIVHSLPYRTLNSRTTTLQKRAQQLHDKDASRPTALRPSCTACRIGTALNLGTTSFQSVTPSTWQAAAPLPHTNHPGKPDHLSESVSTDHHINALLLLVSSNCVVIFVAASYITDYSSNRFPRIDRACGSAFCALIS